MPDKVLTGVDEYMRGFVGKRCLSNKPTMKGRPRVTFDLCAGDTDLAKLKVPTWRHCVAYDDLALRYADVHPGELFKVQGYVRTGVKKDYAGKPIFIANGEPVTEDFIIVSSIIRLKHQGSQYHMFDYTPSGVYVKQVDMIPE